jgi:hypothetical protein
MHKLRKWGEGDDDLLVPHNPILAVLVEKGVS